jgi:hypothetical protein
LQNGAQEQNFPGCAAATVLCSSFTVSDFPAQTTLRKKIQASKSNPSPPSDAPPSHHYSAPFRLANAVIIQLDQTAPFPQPTTKIDPKIPGFGKGRLGEKAIP